MYALSMGYSKMKTNSTWANIETVPNINKQKKLISY